MSVLAEMRTVPWLKIAPPIPAPPPPRLESPPLARPPVRVTSRSVRRPPPAIPSAGETEFSVLGFVWSAATKNSLTGAALGERAIVAPLPSIVTSLEIGGRPFGPYQ